MLIETKQLVLRPVEPEDAEFLAGLMDEIDLHDSSGPYSLIHPTSKEIEERWISQIGSRGDEAHMIIEKRAGRTPIGIISVSEMEKRNSSAHIGIRLKEESWDRGYGTEAVRGAVKFMFESLNIHRVWLRADEENARAIRCYEKCGFTLEGVLRENHIRNGGWKSSVVMSVLKGELKEERR
jgi:RimJ/RimL family protein N-acetyltransferase